MSRGSGVHVQDSRALVRDERIVSPPVLEYEERMVGLMFVCPTLQFSEIWLMCVKKVVSKDCNTVPLANASLRPARVDVGGVWSAIP